MGNMGVRCLELLPAEDSVASTTSSNEIYVNMEVVHIGSL